MIPEQRLRELRIEANLTYGRVAITRKELGWLLAQANLRYMEKSMWQGIIDRYFRRKK